MLEELSVRNYALIEESVIGLRPGFNVLTGETGAGKSILVGSLGLILGAKADQGVIRTGTDEAQVAAVVRVSSSEEARRWLAEREIAFEDGCVVVRRTLRRTGRSSAFIQSVPAALSDLQQFMGFLVDMHGQHEHQSLFNSDNHRRFLDLHAGLAERVLDFGRRFQELSQLRKTLEDIVREEKALGEEAELLAHALDEIARAELKHGEEELLVKEKKLLLAHERLAATMTDLLDAVAENRGGALAALKRARGAALSAVGLDESLQTASDRLDGVFYELEDVVEELKGYESRLEFNQTRLEELEERLSLLHRLQKKYGSSVEAVLSYAEKARERLAGIENRDREKDELTRRARKAEQELLAEASEIASARRAAAARLEESILAALNELGMRKTRFKVSFGKKQSPAGGLVIGPTGMDDVAFEISANPGEPLKPLRAIASGGELSRIMLAIKAALADADDIGSLVFDEIDSGIGGEVGLAVGAYLRRLASRKQVLCITHLASIAVQADHHFRVQKKVDKDRTMTDIVTIEGEQRVNEIARMLSGEPSETTSRRHAQELLNRYRIRQGS